QSRRLRLRSNPTYNMRWASLRLIEDARSFPPREALLHQIQSRPWKTPWTLPASLRCLVLAPQRRDPITWGITSGRETEALAGRGSPGRRNRDGRQRTLGSGAWSVCRRRSPGRLARVAPRRRVGDRRGRRVARRLRVLDRELDAPRRRGRSADGDLRRDDRP